MTPRAVDVGARRREIAAAVRRVLARDGVEAVTMRIVAAELESTTGLLTHWVPTRAALIHLALTETANEQTERAIAVLLHRPTDIAGAAAQFLPLDDERLTDMKVWLGFWALAISNPALAAEQRDRYRDFRAHLGEHLRGLGVSARIAEPAAERIMTAIDGICVAAVFDPDHWTPRRQLRHIRDVVAPLVPQ